MLAGGVPIQPGVLALVGFRARAGPRVDAHRRQLRRRDRDPLHQRRPRGGGSLPGRRPHAHGSVLQLLHGPQDRSTRHVQRSVRRLDHWRRMRHPWRRSQPVPRGRGRGHALLRRAGPGAGVLHLPPCLRRELWRRGHHFHPCPVNDQVRHDHATGAGWTYRILAARWRRRRRLGQQHGRHADKC